jgi:hypothetical protein
MLQCLAIHRHIFYRVFLPMSENKIQKENLLKSRIIKDLLRILDFCQVSHQTTTATTKADIKSYCHSVSNLNLNLSASSLKFLCIILSVYYEYENMYI